MDLDRFNDNALISRQESEEKVNKMIKENKMIDLNNTWCEATKENYNKILDHGIYGTANKAWLEFKNTILLKKEDKFIIKNGSFFRVNNKYNTDNLKQVHLVKGQFEYVEDYNMAAATKSINKKMPTAKEATKGFNKLSEIARTGKIESNRRIKVEKVNPTCPSNYGFEVPDDFECEIYFININSTTKKNCYFGSSIDADCALYWLEDGRCFSAYNGREMEVYNLTPIKKPWYEDESNFPCLIVWKDGNNKDLIDTVYSYRSNKLFMNDEEERFNADDVRPATKEEVLKLLVEP